MVFPTGLEWRGRAGTRLAAFSFNGTHQRRFFPADKRARTHADFEVEVEFCAHDVIPEQAHFAGLVQGILQPVHRKGIFGAHIHIALVGTDAVPGDDHGLNDAVRIAFQYAPVHERARVAFVGITQHVFFVTGRFAREFPFKTGQEPGAAAAAQARLLHCIRDFFGRHFGQHPGQRLIPVAGDIFFDVCRVDDAAVAQDDFLLLLEEVDFLQRGNNLRRGGHLEVQAANGAAFKQVLGHDFLGVLRLQSLVKHTIRVNDRDGANRARPQASRAHQLHFLVQVVLAQGFLKRRDDGMSTGSHASRASANQHMRMNGFHKSKFSFWFCLLSDRVIGR